MSANQIQEWKEEDPDDIDEMPVKPAHLDRACVLPRNRAVPRPPKHPRHDAESDDHVKGVEAGHDEIQREKDLRVCEILGFELKPGTGDMMRHELLVVLDGFDP